MKLTVSLLLIAALGVTALAQSGNRHSGLSISYDIKVTNANFPSGRISGTEDWSVASDGSSKVKVVRYGAYSKGDITTIRVERPDGVRFDVIENVGSVTAIKDEPIPAVLRTVESKCMSVPDKHIQLPEQTLVGSGKSFGFEYFTYEHKNGPFTIRKSYAPELDCTQVGYSHVVTAPDGKFLARVEWVVKNLKKADFAKEEFLIDKKYKRVSYTQGTQLLSDALGQCLSCSNEKALEVSMDADKRNATKMYYGQ